MMEISYFDRVSYREPAVFWMFKERIDTILANLEDMHSIDDIMEIYNIAEYIENIDTIDGMPEQDKPQYRIYLPLLKQKIGAFFVNITVDNFDEQTKIMDTNYARDFWRIMCSFKKIDGITQEKFKGYLDENPHHIDDILAHKTLAKQFSDVIYQHLLEQPYSIRFIISSLFERQRQPQPTIYIKHTFLCDLVVAPRATTTLKVEALWKLKKILQKYETFCSKPIDKGKILCYNVEWNNLFQGEAMSRTTDSKKQIILDFINEYYGSYGETPTVRDIAAGTGIAVTSVHRYLSAMKENGELEYNGRRSVSTRRMEMEQVAHAMPVLGYVACGEGQEETEQVIEYIRMPESLVGKGEFFALIAKGESMIDAGIHPGDYVMIRKQNTAEIGDIVVALDQGVNNLKVLGFNHNKGAYFLRSCNEDKERYGDIYPEELQIQGVAVCVAHRLKKML